MCVSAVLAYIHVKAHVDSRNKSHKYLGRFSEPNLGKNLHFIGLTLGRKIKSVESNRNMKFTHNVD